MTNTTTEKKKNVQRKYNYFLQLEEDMRIYGIIFNMAIYITK